MTVTPTQLRERFARAHATIYGTAESDPIPQRSYDYADDVWEVVLRAGMRVVMKDQLYPKAMAAASQGLIGGAS